MFSRHLHTKRNRRVLLVTVVALLAVILAACTMPRPSPRPAAQTRPTPVPPPSPTSTQFPSEPAFTIGDKPDTVPGEMLVKLAAQPALRALGAETAADGVAVTGLPGIDALNREFGVMSFEPLVQPVVEAERATADNATMESRTVDNLVAESPGLLGIYVVSYDPQFDPNTVATAYSASPSVVFAEPNAFAYRSGGPLAPLGFTPNDPFFDFQWHMSQIQTPQAWDVSSGQNVLVAVLDTGIAYEDFEGFRRAPDLGSTRFRAGYDFINNDAHANDDEGHGTHVAGTIAQSTNNGIGVTGVAFGATLMPVKVLDNRGQGGYDTIAQGIIFAADTGARIINMSLSGRAGSQTLADAVAYAARKGVLVVAAAGNSGGAVEYPAAYPDTLAVGSVGFNRMRVDYSNFGPQLDLVAPGGDTDADLNGDGNPDGVLQQTFRGDPTQFNLYWYEGTSMAAPHVSGTAALLIAHKPSLTPREVRDILQTTSQDLGTPGRDDQYGFGLIQAARALGAIGPPTPTPQPTTPTPTLTPGTPGPTRTPTITTTPFPVSGDLIINGGFETEGGWVFTRTRYPAGYSTEQKRSGARSARLGIVDGPDIYSYSSIFQKVMIPADAKSATLKYWTYPMAENLCPGDQHLILVMGGHRKILAEIKRTPSNERKWIEGSYDMMQFKGHTVMWTMCH
jgi:serine protease